MNFYLLTYLIHQLLLNFSSIMNNFPDKEKVRWQLACHCIQYLPKRGDLNGRTQKKKKKKNHSINTFPSLRAKKKKYNDNNNKKERFVRNRSANLSPTHAHTHIRVFYSFFIIIFFFFSSTRCTETSWKMRQRKWKNDKNVTRSMERARWNGGEGGREGEGWQNVEPSS